MSKRKYSDSTEILTESYFNKIISTANNIQLNNFLNEESWEILDNISKQNGVPIAYLLPGMISTTSHFMGHSKIQINEYQIQKCIFYTALLGTASSGKTPALQIFSKAAYLVENTLNIPEAESQIANGGTVEAVIELLKNNNTIFSIFDEGSAFIGSLGRYNSGGATYDRSVYLELFNGPDIYNRDLKMSRTRCVQPKLNMTLAGHPSTFIRTIKEEIDNYDDGLFQRFLFCVPTPLSNATRKQIRSNSKPKCSLVCIFFTIQQFCSIPFKYEFDQEALDEYYSTNYTYGDIIDKARTVDSFIGAMYGKATTHLIRLSGIINMFKKTVDFISTIPDCEQQHVTNEFKNFIQSKINDEQIREKFYVINRETVNQAKTLLNYFNSNRIVLANYPIKLDEFGNNLNEEVENFLQVKSQLINKSPLLHQQIEDLDKKIKNTMKQVIIHTSSSISTTEIAQKFRIPVVDITTAFKKLVDMELGTITEVKQANNKTVTFFHKRNPSDFKYTNLNESLYKLNITMEEYQKNYKQSNLSQNCVSPNTPIICKTKYNSITKENSELELPQKKLDFGENNKSDEIQLLETSNSSNPPINGTNVVTKNNNDILNSDRNEELKIKEIQPIISTFETNKLLNNINTQKRTDSIQINPLDTFNIQNKIEIISKISQNDFAYSQKNPSKSDSKSLTMDKNEESQNTKTSKTKTKRPYTKRTTAKEIKLNIQKKIKSKETIEACESDLTDNEKQTKNLKRNDESYKTNDI